MEKKQLADAIGGLPIVQKMNQDDRVVIVSGGKGQQISASGLAFAIGTAIANDDRFYIQWKTSDLVKSIEYGGNSTLIEIFRDWVERGARPCEIKKDGTDFAFLRNTEGVASSTNWLKREDGSDSHYASDDKTDYLQQVRIKSINIGFAKDAPVGYERVYFNLDSNACPSDMYPLFIDGYKDMPRYDMTFNDDGTTCNSCAGKSQPEGNWSANLIYSTAKVTNPDMVFVTAWEISAFAWIQAAYYGTFDMQTALARGLESGGEATARGFVNGSTDTLADSCGKIDSGAFRFMYMENFCWGKQHLWGAGFYQYANGKYRMTLDDNKAAKAIIISESDADIIGDYGAVETSEWQYGSEVDLITGVALNNLGSTSKSFFDGSYKYSSGGTVFYAGCYSVNGSTCGAFARYLAVSASSSGWYLRGRCSLKS